MILAVDASDPDTIKQTQHCVSPALPSHPDKICLERKQSSAFIPLTLLSTDMREYKFVLRREEQMRLIINTLHTSGFISVKICHTNVNFHISCPHTLHSALKEVK